MIKYKGDTDALLNDFYTIR